MDRMDMHSRDEYLKVLKKGYFKTRSKKEKPQILDGYCRNSGQSRKYVIRKIHKADLMPRQRYELWFSSKLSCYGDLVARNCSLSVRLYIG